MRDDHFDALARMALEPRSRRLTLKGAGIGLFTFAAMLDLSLAKNTNNAPPTCEEQCFSQGFDFCFARPEGVPICADGADTGGNTPCTTDQDCVDNDVGPYCLENETTAATGITSRFTTCEPYDVGCCILITNGPL